jgi:hypothetical protein
VHYIALSQGEKNALTNWFRRYGRYEMSNVTSESFVARLLRSAEQAAAIKAGEIEPARRSFQMVPSSAEADEIETIQVEAPASNGASGSIRPNR